MSSDRERYAVKGMGPRRTPESRIVLKTTSRFAADAEFRFRANIETSRADPGNPLLPRMRKSDGDQYLSGRSWMRLVRAVEDFLVCYRPPPAADMPMGFVGWAVGQVRGVMCTVNLGGVASC